MFEHTSRYARVADARYVTSDGEEIVYKVRRFLPRGETLPLLGQVTVRAEDRLDLIAAHTLGNPELFWRICDANNALSPWELTDRPGRLLRVPLLQPGE
ncbi:MAG TPA: hypothetical protein VHG28_25245 [Longimicrobiaceae bacterium]|nr:hypothetical protein [Longimicrobiaceae bacterium]